MFSRAQTGKGGHAHVRGSSDSVSLSASSTSFAISASLTWMMGDVNQREVLTLTKSISLLTALAEAIIVMIGRKNKANR